MTQQVYILEDKNSGLLKVGISVDVAVRVGQVNKEFGCDAEIIGVLDVNDAAKTERFIHGMLEDGRVVGEWFEVSERKKNYLLAYFTDRAIPPTKPYQAPSARRDTTCGSASNIERRRQVIRARMTELGLSQDRLAELVNARRAGREKNKGEVTRHAVSRAINHAGELPPILEDILAELGLVATLEKQDAD